MRHLFILLILFVSAGTILASEPSDKVDSLKKAYESAGKNDFSTRAEILRKLYDQYIVNDLPAALSVATMQSQNS